MTKQKRWQIKQREAGNCERCGKPRNKYKYECDPCRAKRNAKQIAQRKLRKQLVTPSTWVNPSNF